MEASDGIDQAELGLNQEAAKEEAKRFAKALDDISIAASQTPDPEGLRTYSVVNGVQIRKAKPDIRPATEIFFPKLQRKGFTHPSIQSYENPDNNPYDKKTKHYVLATRSTGKMIEEESEGQTISGPDNVLHIWTFNADGEYKMLRRKYNDETKERSFEEVKMEPGDFELVGRIIGAGRQAFFEPEKAAAEIEKDRELLSKRLLDD